MNWKEIIIHHTATPWNPGRLRTPAIQRYHIEARGWRDIGYHFLCERHGVTAVVVCGRPLAMIGAHSPGHNSTGIGFAFVGDFMSSGPPTDMLEIGAYHLAGLCKQFKIAVEDIIAHRDVRATSCPGDSFPMQELRELVRQNFAKV